MFAKFEIRRLDLPAARKIMGAGIGMCPKEALFKGYIDLEIEACTIYGYLRQETHLMACQLREFDRARTLYEKYIEVSLFFSNGHDLIRPLARPSQLARVDKVRRARIPTTRLCAHAGHL